MIRNLVALTDLAVVGMSVVLPGGGDINEFGRRIYRGLPMPGPYSEGFSVEFAIAEAIRQGCKEANQSSEHVHIISLSAPLTAILERTVSASQVQEVLGITPALTAASDWLESSGEDAVLLIELQEDAYIVSTILIGTKKSALDNGRLIYAQVAGAAKVEGPLKAEAIASVINEARRISGIQPETTGLIIAATLKDGTMGTEEAEGMLHLDGSKEPQTCALGSPLPGLLGMVKTVWCLSRRVIPGVPGWREPLNMEDWERSCFYVESNSKAWFIPANQNKRFAGFNLVETNGSFFHIIFYGPQAVFTQFIEAPSLEALHLFPIASNSTGEMLKKFVCPTGGDKPRIKPFGGSADCIQTIPGGRS